ncbi:MAG: fibronectin type III domain-containing protein, partial [Armatimonadota bacterium]
MQQLRKSTVSRAISVLLAAALLIPQCLVYVSGAAAQQGQNVPAVTVVPFQDLTGKASVALLREATAASALALEDSKEYLVTSIADLDRELAALRLAPPLSQAQQARLGERLHVEKVLMGSVAGLAVDARTGRAHVELHLMMLDVSIGEYLDGGAVAIDTNAIPGFNGDVSQVTHEALRAAAEAAVSKMLSSSVRRGAVELVDDQGNINVNLGTSDGIEVGTELLVMRPTWQPDVEQVIMRRVGIIRVSEIESNLSVARATEGSIPTSGDRIYRLYKPYSVVQAEQRSQKIKNSGKMIAGLLLLLGLAAMVNGPTTTTPSGVSSCQLVQGASGQSPFVQIKFRTGSTGSSKTHGFLVFRSSNNPDFPAVAQYLVEMIQGFATAYTDDPARNDTTTGMTVPFQYLDTTTSTGALTAGNVTATFIHPSMVEGTRYFYRVRRISDPLANPGSNPPIGTAQTVIPIITPTPDWRVITEASNSAGPVTFFTVPLLSAPTSGQSNLLTTGVTFSWQTVTGANEYIVEVFPSTDPTGQQSPVLQSAVQRSTGTTIMSTTLNGPFSASTSYYWRVGARQSADPSKPQSGNKTGWLYSEIRTFSTSTTPPPPPGSSTTAQSRKMPVRQGGFWGAGHRGGH